MAATNNDLCPGRAVLAYVTFRETRPGAFFCATGGSPMTKSRFVEMVRSSLSRAGVPIAGYSGQFQNWGRDSGGPGGNPGFGHPGLGTLV
jgi:hypothetical protein